MPPPEKLAVTTHKKADAATTLRASEIAARLGVTFEARRGRSLARLQREAAASMLYVLQLERDEIVDGEQILFTNPGRYTLKILDGAAHPLVRAAAPPGAAPVDRVIDATLGMAGDALHLAGALNAQIDGFEASAPLAELLREGLARMTAARRKWAAAAARVRVQAGDAADLLAAMPPASAPVVLLDPMFDRPLGAPPAFDLLRRLARSEPLDLSLLDAACRVATRRVVLKIPGASPVPRLPGQREHFNRRVRGQAVDYLIIERELPPDGSMSQP